VGEIGIHLDDKVVALLQSPLEPRDIGATQTVLRRAGEKVEARFGGRGLLDPATGSIGGTIINDQDLHPIRKGKKTGDHLREIIHLVIGGDDD